MNKKVYLCITTTKHSDWRKQIRDLDYFREDTVSAFPTALKLPERKEFYKLLLASDIKNIPHVHLRDDMNEEEAVFFIKNFNTKVFTVHARNIDYFLSWKISKCLFAEFNYSNTEFDLEKINKIGGFCIDCSHFYRARSKKTTEYRYISEGIKKYKVGCNHISGILSDGKDSHLVKNIYNFDYLNTIPKEMFSPYICLEVENGIEKQIKFRDYITEKLKSRNIISN